MSFGTIHASFGAFADDTKGKVMANRGGLEVLRMTKYNLEMDGNYTNGQNSKLKRFQSSH